MRPTNLSTSGYGMSLQGAIGEVGLFARQASSIGEFIRVRPIKRVLEFSVIALFLPGVGGIMNLKRMGGDRLVFVELILIIGCQSPSS